MMSLAPVFASLGRAESYSVRYKDLLRAKKILGVIGTLSLWFSD